MRNVVVSVLLGLLLVLCACAHRNPEDLPLHPMRIGDMFPNDPQTQSLALAASKGDIQEIDQLVAEGADVNATGTRGIPVLTWVLGHPNKDGFRRLLEHGANPNLIWGKETKYSPLHMAALLISKPTAPGLDADFIIMLLTVGNGNPNLELPDGSRPIRWAVSRRDRDVFAILYNAGAKLDYADSYGATLLSKAYFDFEMIYFMITHGVDYKHESKELHEKRRKYTEETLGGKYLVEPGRPDICEGNIKHYLSWVKEQHDEAQWPQELSKDTWFWRCIDFLEKHGVDCRIPPEAEKARPAALPTTPTTYEIAIEKWKAKHAN